MSEEPIDDIELEEAEPVDRSFLDVSLVEEVNSNSQENCCGVCNKVFRGKAHLVTAQFTLDFNGSKKPLSDVPSKTCPRLRIPDIKRRNFP
jgi:hypothetical protein